jgi:hypothetical protein
VQELGRLLILFGVVALLMGGLLLLLGRVPGLGRLPGDFVVQRGPVTFYFPLVTSILLSILLTILLNLFWRR